MREFTENSISELYDVLAKAVQFPMIDGKKLAEDIPLIAQALRKENLSEGQIQAALLSICGVQVDDLLVRYLTRFQ